MVSDNRDLVRYFRDQGGVTDHQAVWNPNLVFTFNEVSRDFYFEAPAPTPSPFRIVGNPAGGGSARLGLPLTPLTIVVGTWAAVPTGVMEDRETVEGRFGETSGYVVPEEGSEMDCIFGAHDGFFSSISEQPFVSVGFDLSNSYIADVVDEKTSDTGRPRCPGRR